MYRSPLNALPAWQALQTLAPAYRTLRITDLFTDHPERGSKFTFDICGSMQLDMSRQAIDDAVLNALLELAHQAQLADGIKQFFAGEKVNFTEQRLASHIFSRYWAPSVPNIALIDDAHDLHHKMFTFTAQIHAKQILGASGKPLKNIINIGIGGSDLGPRLLVEAILAGQRPLVPVRFVANIDPTELAEVLLDLNPEETLFILSSKSFTTQETLSNAHTARLWLAEGLRAVGHQIADHTIIDKHFIAVTQNVEAAKAWGIRVDNIFRLPASVGGRFSVWSGVGLPALLAIGEGKFRAFLAGGCSVDRHFSEAPFSQNLPVLMALTTLWNTQFLAIESLAVLPYAYGLRSFPTYLQQLEMESNGKSVTYEGKPVAWHTAQIVWGLTGTNGQHAFHQLLYQGTRRCALDFIVPNMGQDEAAQALRVNAKAQAQALMQGCSLAQAKALLQQQGHSDADINQLAPHYMIAGNQPSNTLSLAHITEQGGDARWGAGELGQLVALYEHKTFVLGWLWGINSFDQFGVELGKQMAREMVYA
jgi:glucose-6-phosphate isomerase